MGFFPPFTFWMNQQIAYRYPVALTIAGSDSGGGAGIQADIKTFSSLGIYGASILTAVTAQNTQGVRGIQAVSPEIIRGQLEAIFEDLPVDAIKVGMLHTIEAVRSVSEILSTHSCSPIILDPVMISTSGSRLLREDAVKCVIHDLFPLTTLLTPNIQEAEYLSGIPIHGENEIKKAADRLLSLGCESVLIKGGHIPGETMTDWLFTGKQEPICLVSPTVETRNTHGTGCTLSSAIAAYMALGLPLTEAVRSAKEYITQALTHGADIQVGKGHGPMNHFFSPVPLRKKRIEK